MNKRSATLILSGMMLCMFLFSAIVPPVQAGPPPITAPHSLSVRQVKPQSIALEWKNPDMTSINGIELHRMINNDSKWELLYSGSPLDTSYVDQQLLPDNTYSYKVRTYLYTQWNFGKLETVYSDFTPEVLVHTPLSDTVPAAPTQLVAQVNGTSATLTWNDNSDIEDYFELLYSSDGGSWNTIYINKSTLTLPHTVSYVFSGLNPASETVFKVRAVKQTAIFSPYTNEVWVEVSSSSSLPDTPAAPTDLTVTGSGTTAVLKWKDNSDNEYGFFVSRKDGTGEWITLKDVVTAGAQEFYNYGLSPGVTYYYRVQAQNQAGSSLVSNTVNYTVPDPDMDKKPATQPVSMELRYYIDSEHYYVNGVQSNMDAVPFISESRTFIPFTYVANPLGATIDWEAESQKVTVRLDARVVELWIGHNTARVNNLDVAIEPGNSAVTPLIVEGRTMLPLSFIAQNLGCQVNWDQAMREIKLTYTRP